MTVPNLLVAVAWFLFFGYWVISAFGAKRNAGGYAMGLAIRILVIVVVISIYRSGLLPRVNRGDLPFFANPAISAIGVILCFSGMAFAVWARRHLGKNWGMPMSVKEDPELVTTGPYAYVRHPIYSGILLAMLGSALSAGSWWIVLFVIFGAYFVYSSRIEERLMTQRFPETYPEYRQHTKRLIPFLW